MLKNLSGIKEKEYCWLPPPPFCPCILYETSFHHYFPKQAVFYYSFNLPLLKPRHWICFFLHKKKSKTEIVPLVELLHLSLFKVKSLNLVFGYLALMWAKVLLVFLNISRQEGPCLPRVHFFLVVLENVQKVFLDDSWMFGFNLLSDIFHCFHKWDLKARLKHAKWGFYSDSHKTTEWWPVWKAMEKRKTLMSVTCSHQLWGKVFAVIFIWYLWDMISLLKEIISVTFIFF